MLLRPQLDLVNSVREATAAIAAQAVEQEAANAVHGKARSTLIELTIAQLERQRADLESTDNVIPGYIQQLELRIAAEKRLLEAAKTGEGLDIAEEVQKKQKDAAQKTSEDIRGIFRTGFVDALNDGDGVLASMGTSIKRTIMTSIADALYDSVLKQAVDGFAAGIGNSVRNALSGAGGGGGGGGGILSGLISGAINYFTGGASAGAAAGAGGSSALPAGVIRAAKGHVFSSSGLHDHVNTVVNKSTFFRFAKGGGFGEMGEAGPEAIMPLQRDGQGRLGVIALGGGASGGIEVHLHNNGQPVSARAEQSQGQDGKIRLDLVIEQLDEALGGRISSGIGALPRSIESRYGLSTAVN